MIIEEAVVAGARRFMACAELGLSVRTVQRWQHRPEDGRPTALRPAPSNQLTLAEREQILAVLNQPEHASLPPHQIVPKLADQGRYIASESTFYRVLKAAGQQHARGRAKAPVKRVATTHLATAPNQVWCWDITWLPTVIKGQYYYWYMMKDVFSRKLVANEVHVIESSNLAARLLTQGCLSEGTLGRPLILHSDNGSAMKGATMLACMQNLGVVPSFSRPRVSNDNAYAESLFRTAKYCPQWPNKPFASIEAAREWVQNFVHWYNEKHRHSKIKFVTPGQRHRGEAEALLSQRDRLYADAKARNPNRWSGNTRNWVLENRVWLNPERDTLVPPEKLAA